MYRTIGVLFVVLSAACAPVATPTTEAKAAVKAVHVASAKDTAFVRASCAMPDSVLAGTRPCIDRVQASPIRVF